MVMRAGDQAITRLLLIAARERRVPIAVFLRNGYQIHGEVEAFDDEVVVLRVDDKQEFVFRQAISTIVVTGGFLDFDT